MKQPSLQAKWEPAECADLAQSREETEQDSERAGWKSAEREEGWEVDAEGGE